MLGALSRTKGFAESSGKQLAWLVVAALVLLSAVPSDAQIFHKKKKPSQSTDAANSAEPDKLLYDRAMGDIKRGRHEVGRLTLQTLINTYPDSEYLAKAKLAIADSYYKEGGTANLSQAIAGYKDFGVFFPFLPEAAYAQMQVAMAHYHEMAKPDRDRTQAKLAEEEFQTFLQKYPKDPLVPKSEQRLRDVQEMLAEGDYRIGYYYYVKGDKRAAAARFTSVARRYPLYSKSDAAVWMLGNIFETTEHKDIAGYYYASLVRNYPLSRLAGDAKRKLVALKVPVPQPDPKAQAWMQAEQNAPHPHQSIVRKPLGILHSGPDFRTAAQVGAPNLEPEADSTSATDVLSGGNRSTLGGARGGATTGIVATVTPGRNDSSGTGENVAPSDDSSTTTAPAGTDPSAAGDAKPADAPADAAPATDDPASGTAPDAGAAASTADGAAKADGTQAGTPAGTSTATPTDPKKESSSKKKKGIKKIIPW